jgi:hypothetical protein
MLQKSLIRRLDLITLLSTRHCGIASGIDLPLLLKLSRGWPALLGHEVPASWPRPGAIATCTPCPPDPPHTPVGASLLAMEVNDNACFLITRVALQFIASRLTPTAKAP